jgi:hypothetical protein
MPYPKRYSFSVVKSFLLSELPTPAAALARSAASSGKRG